MSQRNLEGGGTLQEWLDLFKSQSSRDMKLVLGWGPV